MRRTCSLADPGWFHEIASEMENHATTATVDAHYHAVFNLLFHENRRKIKLTPGVGFVYTSEDHQCVFDGLTKTLDSVFHPVALGIPTGGARTGGAARGNRVDSEIAALVNKGREPKGGLYMDYTVRALEFLRARNMQPFAAQFDAYEADLGIATSLDILCINHDAPSKKIVNVQLKTTERNYTRANGYFASPHPDVKESKIKQIKDSKYARDQLQILLEHIMVRRAYGKVPLESMVLVVTSESAQSYPLGSVFKEITRDVFVTLMDRNTPKIPRARSFELAFASRAQHKNSKRIFSGKTHGATKKPRASASRAHHNNSKRISSGEKRGATKNPFNVK